MRKALALDSLRFLPHTPNPKQQHLRFVYRYAAPEPAGEHEEEVASTQLLLPFPTTCVSICVTAAAAMRPSRTLFSPATAALRAKTKRICPSPREPNRKQPREAPTGLPSTLRHTAHRLVRPRGWLRVADDGGSFPTRSSRTAGPSRCVSTPNTNTPVFVLTQLFAHLALQFATLSCDANGSTGVGRRQSPLVRSHTFAIAASVLVSLDPNAAAFRSPRLPL